MSTSRSDDGTEPFDTPSSRFVSRRAARLVACILALSALASSCGDRPSKFEGVYVDYTYGNDKQRRLESENKVLSKNTSTDGRFGLHFTGQFRLQVPVLDSAEYDETDNVVLFHRQEGEAKGGNYTADACSSDGDTKGCCADVDLTTRKEYDLLWGTFSGRLCQNLEEQSYSQNVEGQFAASIASEDVD